MAYHVRYALPAEAARNTSIESKIPTPNFQKLGPGWYRLAMKILFSWNLERWRLWFFTPCIFDMWDDNTKRVDWATRQNLKQQGAQLSAMLIDQHLHATRLAASWTQPPHCEDRSWAARFWEWEQFFWEKTTLKLKHVANGTVLADTLGKPKLCGSEQVQMRFKVQSSILLLIFFVLGIFGIFGFLRFLRFLWFLWTLVLVALRWLLLEGRKQHPWLTWMLGCVGLHKLDMALHDWRPSIQLDLNVLPPAMWFLILKTYHI